MDSLVRIIFPFLIPALLSLTGCADRRGMDAADADKVRAKLTLAEEPEGVQTVSEARMALLGEAPPNVLALLEDEHEHGGKAEHAAGEAVVHDGEVDETVADEHGPDEREHAEGRGPSATASDAVHHGDVKEADVVLVGVVGGVPNPFTQTQPDFPFAKHEAVFFLADPEAVAQLEEHGHEHAPGEECAFCAAHAADAATLVAAVRFLDANGKPYRADARALFGLQAGDTVVVTGKARAATKELMSIDATGLYVRR